MERIKIIYIGATLHLTKESLINMEIYYIEADIYNETWDFYHSMDADAKFASILNKKWIENNIITFAEWRDKQIDSILND